MTKIHKTVPLFGIIISLLFTSTLLNIDVFAASSVPTSEQLLQKTLLNGLHSCVNKIYWKDVEVSKYSNINSLLTAEASKDGIVKVPNGIANTLKDGDISCKELFNGYSGAGGKIPGLISLSGNAVPAASSPAAVEAFLKSIGYTPVKNTTAQVDKKCVSTNYGISGGSKNNNTTTICMRVDSKTGKIVAEDLGQSVYPNNSLALDIGYDGSRKELAMVSNCSSIKAGCLDDNLRSAPVKDGITWDEFFNLYNSFAKGNDLSDKPYYYGVNRISAMQNDAPFYLNNINQQNTAKSDKTESATSAYSAPPKLNNLIGYFSSYKSSDEAYFTEYEKFHLYKAYLLDFYGLDIDDNQCVSSKPANNSKGYYIPYGSASSMKWCKVVGNFSLAESRGRVNGFAKSGPHVGEGRSLLLTTYDVYGLITAIQGLNYSDKSFEGGDLKGAVVKTEDTKAKDDMTDPCYDNAGILGWLICPAITTTLDFSNNLYKHIEEKYLKINADSIFNITPNTASDTTHQAWNIVRNIANIVFAIFILIIIFSQLTGAGIDNYGIKRTLPRLIIAAILVNASWIICRFAVDLSNVVGVGIGGILNPGQIQMNVTAADVKLPTVDKATAYIAELGLGGVIGISALLINPGVILGVLLALLTVAGSVLFFWLILLAREVAVILLIVLAPLAFVCYLLPNTENLFKRWIKIAEAMLVLYPLCSLVVYGGRLVSSILAAQGGASVASMIAPIFGATKAEFTVDKGLCLAAMIVQVAPYFLIPTLLKNSLAGIGNLGAKLSNMGSRLGRGASNGIRNSEGYKNTRARSLERKNRIKAGLDENGNVKTGRFARASSVLAGGFTKRSRARAVSQYFKDNDERQRIDKLSDPNYIQDMAARNEAKRLEDAVSDRESSIRNSDMLDDVGALQGKLQESIMSGDTVGIRAYQNVLSNKGEGGRQAVHDAMVKAQEAGNVSDEARRTYSSNIMNKWGDDYKNNSRSTYEYAKANTGKEAKGTIASYYGQNTDGLKQKQMAAMDEAELKRYLEAMQKDTFDSTERAKLGQLAQDTLNNDYLKGDIKRSQSDILQEMASYASSNNPTPAPAVPQSDNTTTDSGLIVAHDGNMSVERMRNLGKPGQGRT